MAIIFDRLVSMLEEPYILLPERYDPRRETSNAGIPLLDIINFGESSIPVSKIPNEYLLLDTTNSFDGFISVNIGDYNKRVESNKKQINRGSIIISRLRPYLRQVGYVDENITPTNVPILSSTEYYELVPRKEESISYLLPFLLSRAVQVYLQHSIEGGNHPRFKQNALAKLSVPIEIFKQRVETSENIEKNIAVLREGYSNLTKIFNDSSMLCEAAN